MGEELPSQYDVIILGTGAPETILAAAIARIGKSVLHLDKNEYYGGDWSSFNFDGLLEWIHTNQISEAVDNSQEFDPHDELLKEGECFFALGNYISNISNVKMATFVQETLPLEEATTNVNVKEASSGINKPQPLQFENVTASSDDSNNEVEVVNSTSQADERSQAPEVEVSRTNQAEPTINDEVKLGRSAARKIWSLEELKAQRRKFNLDLAPKLLFSRGPLVELLISSNISRYAEFKCTTRVLTCIDEQLIQVPCSRADVFSTKHVTVVEKRLLMKFLTFALEYQKHPEEYRGFEGRPFIEFLKAKKLTQHVEHYLIHAIAMVDPSTPTLQSLNSVQKFLESLGRFGNSPFLWPLYGSAELPQCFCRLCAVFGGIYFLKRSVQAVIRNSEGACTAVVSDGKRLDCSWLIMESGYAPRSLLQQVSAGKISRGIFITDDSLLHSEKEQLTLLRLPPDGNIKTTITILELGPSAYVCPSGLYIVYMSCSSSGANAEQDLGPAMSLLFDCTTAEVDAGKPKLLWCVFYNQKDTSTLRFSENIRDNVLLTSTPDLDHDYEQSVNEARALFERMFPEEPFLPRAPDPDEILIEPESNSNPGHSKDEEIVQMELLEDATEEKENDSNRAQQFEENDTNSVAPLSH